MRAFFAAISAETKGKEFKSHPELKTKGETDILSDISCSQLYKVLKSGVTFAFGISGTDSKRVLSVLEKNVKSVSWITEMEYRE